MIKSIKAARLRENLSDVLNEIDKGEDYLLVTKRGKPVSALVNLDFFEDLMALASSEYLESIKEARADFEAGRTFAHDEVFGEL